MNSLIILGFFFYILLVRPLYGWIPDKSLRKSWIHQSLLVDDTESKKFLVNSSNRKISTWKDMKQYRKYKKYEKLEDASRRSGSVHLEVVWFQKIIRILRDLSARIEFFYDHVVIRHQESNSILGSSKESLLLDEEIQREHDSLHSEKIAEVHLKRSIQEISRPKPPPM